MIIEMDKSQEEDFVKGVMLMMSRRKNNFEDLVKQRCQSVMMMVSQEGVALTTQQLGSPMKTATLHQIQVPMYRGD